MKIAFLNMYNGMVNRGAETFVDELASRLSYKHEVTVFQAGDISKKKYKVEKINMDLESGQKDATGTFLRRIFMDYWSIKVLKFTLLSLPILSKSKFDILFPINGGWMSIVLRIFTLLKGSKLVIAAQSGTGWDDRINIYTIPNLFIAISTKALKWAERTNPFVKSVYIPNGTDLKVFTPSVLRKRPRRVILSVGAFTEQKRHDLVINAVSKINNVKLIIAGGGGNLKEKLNRLCLEKLGKSNYEIIETRYEQMPEVYKSASVFTLASSPSESFGIVIVEALASGLPVVVTNDPIRKEIVGDAGFFVDPEDTNEYASILSKALNSKWDDKPRKQAEKFDWDIIAHEYESQFNLLIK